MGCKLLTIKFQVNQLGQPFVVQHVSGLPDCWLSDVIWRRSPSAAFCWVKDLCRQADLQQLWGSMFRGCWPNAVEQPSSRS